MFEAGKKTQSGYLAVPSSGSGPGVLVLPAWWGLNEFFVGLCDRLAQEGFVALAPDWYGGAIARTVPEAKELQGTLDFASTQSNVVEALKALRQHPATQGSKVGAVGFSMGAAWALQLSAHLPEDITAVVVFYGLDTADFKAARAAYLCHFAEKDEWEPLEQVPLMEADMRAAGRETTFYTYPGVEHWFFESDRPNEFNAEAAQLAWERTLVFLRDQLSPTKVSKTD